MSYIVSLQSVVFACCVLLENATADFCDIYLFVEVILVPQCESLWFFFRPRTGVKRNSHYAELFRRATNDTHSLLVLIAKVFLISFCNVLACRRCVLGPFFRGAGRPTGLGQMSQGYLWQQGADASFSAESSHLGGPRTGIHSFHGRLHYSLAPQ